MAEILHQLIWRIYHYLRRVLYIPGGDRRISEPSTVGLHQATKWLNSVEPDGKTLNQS